MMGTMSIILSMEGNYYRAAVAVLVAMLFDGLDGWLAKILHTTSDFGAKLDSLADIVSFGIAPAVILYGIVLNDLGILGWIVVILFITAGAIRLALFNFKATPSYFVGLPITAAGGITAALVISGVDIPVWGWSIILILLATLMVSRVRYPDIKRLPAGGSIPWEISLFIGAGIAVALVNPKHLIFLPFLIYLVYGIIKWSLSKVNK